MSRPFTQAMKRTDVEQKPRNLNLTYWTLNATTPTLPHEPPHPPLWVVRVGGDDGEL